MAHFRGVYYRGSGPERFKGWAWGICALGLGRGAPVWGVRGAPVWAVGCAVWRAACGLDAGR